MIICAKLEEDNEENEGKHRKGMHIGIKHTGNRFYFLKKSDNTERVKYETS
jgi:hypothetical protein